MLTYWRKDVLEGIKEWKTLISKIELCDENILNLWMCLDFGKMYDLAREMNIVQGYLFSEVHRTGFIEETYKAIGSSTLIENERKHLNELLTLSAEEYLDNLYAQAAYKLYARNEAFSEELQQDFYKVIKAVSELNIEAIKRYFTEKACVNT